MTHSRDHSLSGWILLLLIFCCVFPASASRYSPSRPVLLHEITAKSEAPFISDSVGNILSGPSADNPAVPVSYGRNHANQATDVTRSGTVRLRGEVDPAATLAVTSGQAYATSQTRQGKSFVIDVTVPQTTADAYIALTNTATLPSMGGLPSITATNVTTVYRPSGAADSLTYDLAGNLIADGRWTYKWDAWNRLTTIESETNAPAASKRKLDFLYDPKGRRIARTISTWTGTAYQVTDSRKFLYDGWKLVAEINATNNLPIRSYTWLGNELVELVQDGVSYLPGYDANGNLTALKKRNGHEIMARYEYGPFGLLLKASGPMAMENPIRFSSEYQDPITGLIYYGYRYYNPATQRWLSRDPIGILGGYNLYGLANNDPVNGRDYLGLSVLDEDPFPLMATGTALDSYIRDPEVNEAIKRAEQREIEEMKDVGASLARLAASFAPGAGETMDGCTLVDPAASDFDKYMAAASLAINGATGGIFPNYSAFRQCRKLDIDDATKLADAAKKQPGSYTTLHESGNRYHGKGPKERSELSGRRIEAETGDKHVATDWSSAANEREAFKDEARRIRADGGIDNPNNYNKRNSPGERYLIEDGEP